jgi:hypothetical protein
MQLLKVRIKKEVEACAWLRKRINENLIVNWDGDNHPSQNITFIYHIIHI